MIRIMLVDDHELIRQGLRRILECDATFRVVAEASNGKDAMDQIPTLLPDVVIADISMPKMSGLELLQAIRVLRLSVKVILLTVENQREILEKCIEAGADGYILKESAGQEINRAIQQVLTGENYVDPNLVGLLFGRIRTRDHHDTNPFSQLTDREFSILQHMVQGLSNREIGQVMFLAEKTVKNNTTTIFKKLQVKDRVNAVLYAVSHHIDRYHR